MIRATATLISIVLGFTPCLRSLDASTPPAVTPQELHDIALDAYVYFYPLVSMDVTRRQFTNIEPGKAFAKGPMNMFAHAPAYPPAEFKGVVRSNFDTLYSSAWLDLTSEPMVVSAPDTGGRYYLLPMLDMWSDVFASPGWRTTGTQPAHYLVTPPGWQGTVPSGMSRIAAPTPYVWAIGRIQTNGPADYDAVRAVQAGCKATPLSGWGKPATVPAVKIDPSVDMKTPPKTQVDTMPGAAYFAYAAELLKVHPPHITDGPMIDRLKRLGFVAGQSFDAASLDSQLQELLAAIPGEGQRLMAWKMPTMARIANGWTMNTETMGVYGNNYLKRAIIAQVGLGANLPEDAIYPTNLGDDTGKPLTGEHHYVLRFEKNELPPVSAFWSVTLYDPEGFQVGNELNRFAVSSWMPFKYDADGSLTLYFQHESPGKEMEANWLPAPKGSFNLTMRLYAPKGEVLVGKWNPPAVARVNAVAPADAR